jgi:hypothetical protein
MQSSTAEDADEAAVVSPLWRTSALKLRHAGVDPRLVYRPTVELCHRNGRLGEVTKKPGTRPGLGLFQES